MQHDDRGSARSVRDLIEVAFDHLLWADERVSRSLAEAEAPPDEAVRRYAHVLGSEETWFARIEARSPMLEIWPRLGVDDCRRTAARHAEYIRTWIGRLADGDETRIIRYRNQSGTAFATRLDDILLHICLHGAYHRGQVAYILRDAGREPIPTDYILYMREMSAS